MSNINTPPANARYDICHDVPTAIFIHKLDEVNISLRAVFEKDNIWRYIAAPTLLEYGIDTKQEIQKDLSDAFDEINAECQRLFSPGSSSEPDGGVEYIQWLLDNKTVFVGNQLKLDV